MATSEARQAVEPATQNETEPRLIVEPGDVYKRQICASPAVLADDLADTAHPRRAPFIGCLLYTSRCV